MIGRDKSRTIWRVLKIDRLDPSELNIREDSTSYTESECYDLLQRIHEGNRATGGLKFVTTCYGIVGTWILLCVLFWTTNSVMILTVVFFLFSRIYQISGAILHAIDYEKKTNWCNLWSQYICCFQE